MAKNKGTHGKGASIPVADQFLLGAESTAQKLKPHVTKIIVLAVVALLCLVTFSVYDWMSKKKRAELTDQLYQALDVSQAPVYTEEGQAPKLDVIGTPMEFLSFSTYDERAKASAQMLQALAEGTSESAAMANLLLGKDRFESKDFEGALKSFRAYLKEGDDLEAQLMARENIAYALEAQAAAAPDASAKQAGFKEALKAFEDMQKDPEGPRRDTSLYHQARLKAELGAEDEAQTLYKKVLADFPESYHKADIENRLMAFGADA